MLVKEYCGCVANVYNMCSCCTVPGAVRASIRTAWRTVRALSLRQRRCSGSAGGVLCVTCVVLLGQTPS